LHPAPWPLQQGVVVDPTPNPCQNLTAPAVWFFVAQTGCLAGL
jgi:hypothetical protein